MDLYRGLGHCINNFGFPVRDHGIKCEIFALIFFFSNIIDFLNNIALRLKQCSVI